MSRYELFHNTVRHAATLTKDSPIVNANLLSFRPEPSDVSSAKPSTSATASSNGERELTEAQRSFLAYWVALTQMIRDVGGRVILAAEVESVVGSAAQLHGWQCVAFVFYPSMAHYRKVIERDQFLQIKHLRRAAVNRSVLYTTVAVNPAEIEAAVSAFERADALHTATLDITTDLRFAEQHGYHLKGVTQLVGDAGYNPWRFFRIRSGGEVATPLGDHHHSVSFNLRSLASLRNVSSKL